MMLLRKVIFTMKIENSFEDNNLNDLDSSKVLFLKNNFKRLNKNKAKTKIFKITNNGVNIGNILCKKEKLKESPLERVYIVAP